MVVMWCGGVVGVWCCCGGGMVWCGVVVVVVVISFSGHLLQFVNSAMNIIPYSTHTGVLISP